MTATEPTTQPAGDQPEPKDDYWPGFTHRIRLEQPGDQCRGRIVKRGRRRTGNGEIPELTLRLRDGSLGTLLVPQAELLTKLREAHPNVGDVIRVEYLGEDKRAAPGMNPLKRWHVEVERRAEPRR